MQIVQVFSKALYLFLPEKETLRKDVAVREKFFEENKFLGVGGGVPFVAGLLDGDGRVAVNVVNKRRYFFGQVNQWPWEFYQTRCMFLVDYAVKFVESPASKSVRVQTRARDGLRTARLVKSGVTALLDAGVAKFSWKADCWLRTVKEVRSERLRYYNVGQVARMLNVSNDVVRGWLKTGSMKYVRTEMSTRERQASLSHYYIPVHEAEKFRKSFLEKKGRMERVKAESVRLIELVEELGIPYTTLRRWCERAEIQITLVREAGGRGWKHLVIPRNEIEKLNKRKERGGRKMEKNVLSDVAPKGENSVQV